MDELLKLFKRFVEAHEKIADSLAEMNADGIAVVITDASGKEQDEKPADEPEEKPEPEEPEEKPEPEEPEEEDPDSLTSDEDEETVIEQKDVRAAVRAYAAKHSEPKAIALMKKYGGKASKISEIKEEFYKAVYDAAKAG